MQAEWADIVARLEGWKSISGSAVWYGVTLIRDEVTIAVWSNILVYVRCETKVLTKQVDGRVRKYAALWTEEQSSLTISIGSLGPGNLAVSLDACFQHLKIYLRVST